MKKYIITLCLIVNSVLFAQNPEIKSDLPTIIPPSPTVAALMKFEEVPVSNYTGVPDVSIPLFSSQTLSKDLYLNVALKYHPAGIAADNVASDTGLGWSLFAGGSISRTVRSLPDELLTNASNQNDVRVGIYHNSNTTHINNYYYFTENIANSKQDYYKPLNQLTNQEINIGNEFLWTAANTNRYDTEHDLWQFNFMGNSGRFYIKKNSQTNQLEVCPLDDYRIKIINHYSSINNNAYTPTGFTIYDEKGYRYVFDIIEKSVNKTTTNSTHKIYDGEAEGYSFQSSIGAEKTFRSSFQLSKIFDLNDNLLIEYIFSTNEFVESFTKSLSTKTDMFASSNFAWNLTCGDFPPIESNINSTTRIEVKKLQTIDVKNQCKINFEYVKGRLDNNINLPNETAYLNSIIIKDYQTNFIKKFVFGYNYSTVLNTRMILQDIKEYDINNQFINNFKFSYKINSTNDLILGKDYWGFFNLIKPCEINTLKHKDVSPEFCTTDVLEKISYPTGGSAVFDYESNRYSFIGDFEITDFSENPENTILTHSFGLNFNNPIIKLIPIVTSDDYIKTKFDSGVVLNEDPSLNSTHVALYKKVGQSWVIATNLMCNYNNPNCCIEYVLEKNIQYGIKYTNFDINNNIPGGVQVEYYGKNPIEKRYLHGGGVRIKNIKYFNTVVLDDLSNINVLVPSKIKNYDYIFFATLNTSSGSLAYPKPIYTYSDMFASNASFFPYNAVGCNNIIKSFIYDNSTTGNSYVALKTSGSDVGYKEVTVYESGNGKSEFTYISPIDFPEITISTGIPFIPSENFDYKRGQLKSEIIYNSLNRKVSEINNNYEYEDYIVHTGTRFRKPVGVCYTGSKFNSYNDYLSYFSQDCIVCQSNSAFSSEFLCGLPLGLGAPKITPFPIFEAYGWAKLASKNTKNYFYPNGSTTPNIVQSNETFTYNSLNKQIASHTVDNSVGDILTTNYFYHTGNSTFSQNRISEIERIETKRGTGLLSESKINYSNAFAGNQSYLPSTIEVKKGSSPSEVRLKNNVYDEFGHVLEVQQESGIKISYIYGYNKTQPVAKIENIAYSAIPNTLITAIQTATNDTAGTEGQVIDALNALRTSTDVNLKNAMITTITYKPLIGISTVTDPKGDKITYHYDSFNRLEFVKDKNENILSENKYHYKN